MDPGGHPPVDHQPEASLPVGLESGSLVRPHLYHNVKSKSADSWYRRSWGSVRHLACVASASPSYALAVGSASALLTISGPDRNGGCSFFPRMPRLSLLAMVRYPAADTFIVAKIATKTVRVTIAPSMTKTHSQTGTGDRSLGPAPASRAW